MVDTQVSDKVAFDKKDRGSYQLDYSVSDKIRAVDSDSVWREPYQLLALYGTVSPIFILSWEK